MRSAIRIWTIAMNTLREAVRNKLLYALLFFAVLLITAGVVLSALSYVESERILQDFGFAAIRLFSVAIAIFVGVSLIHREVERRTVYTILAKPLSRAEFLLGKYVGLVVTIWMQMAVMVAAFLLVSRSRRGRRINAGHAVAFGLTAVELAVDRRGRDLLQRLHHADAGLVLLGRDLGTRPPEPRSARHRRELGLRIGPEGDVPLPPRDARSRELQLLDPSRSRPGFRSVRCLAAAGLRHGLRRDPAGRARSESSNVAICAEYAPRGEPDPEAGTARACGDGVEYSTADWRAVPSPPREPQLNTQHRPRFASRFPPPFPPIWPRLSA